MIMLLAPTLTFLSNFKLSIIIIFTFNNLNLLRYIGRIQQFQTKKQI